MDYTNFKIISSNEEENAIIIRLEFGDKDIIVIEPAQSEWPEDIEEFCLQQIRMLKDPTYQHHAPGTPTSEGEL